MGSFNTSCFASNQTIASGDACLVLPIRQKSTYQAVKLTWEGVKQKLPGLTSSTCYATAFWRPVGHFMTARYDDYGCVELEDTPANRLRMGQFLGYCLRRTAAAAQGENKYHDHAYDLAASMAKETPELLDWLQGRPSTAAGALLWAQSVQAWDYIWKVASSHRLFGVAVHGDSELRPVQFAVIHRAAYDRLVTLAEGLEHFDNGPMGLRDMFDRNLANARSKLLANYATTLPGKLSASALSCFERSFLDEELRYIGCPEGMSYPDEQLYMRSALEPFTAGALSVDGLFEQLKPWFEARYAFSGLEVLNLKLQPLVYNGQDYNNEVGREYAKFVRSTSAAVTRGRNRK